MSGPKSSREMVEFLKEGAMYRDFGTVLRSVFPFDDLNTRLARGLSEINGEDYEKTIRKVRNWVNGKNLPQKREVLFQICFVLGLGEDASDKILATASDTGIHYRNPEEICYAFALRNGYSYDNAVLLKKEMMKRYETVSRNSPENRVYTKQVRTSFDHVRTEEDLLEFFDENGAYLGYLHETAYEKFVELLDALQKPAERFGETERKYTMDEVVSSYIRMNVPETKATAGYTLLQRLVKKYWPGETNLVNMRSRREDVSRKTIILLYLVTEAFDGLESDDLENYYLEDLEEEDDRDNLLAIRFEKMNLFLVTYGMNRLDPGNPFDFLVLYAMKTEQEEFAGDRMEQVLNELFQDEQKN